MNQLEPAAEHAAVREAADDDNRGGANTDSGSGRDFVAEKEAFYSHAKWLLEWHNKRSDGFNSRAVALLGFVGVTLALLASGVNSSNATYDETSVRLLAAVGTALLLACAFFCFRTLTARTTTMAALGEFRTAWHQFMHAPSSGGIQAQVVEDLLHGNDLASTESPLDQAKKEADDRAYSFQRATWILFAAVIVFAALFMRLIFDK